MKRTLAALATFAVLAAVSSAQTNRLVIIKSARMVTGVGAAAGQAGNPSYCTPSSPCLQLTATLGADIAAAVTTNAQGLETAGPATVAVYICTVSSTQTCSTYSAGSAWAAEGATNGQSLSATASAWGPFYVTGLPFGQTYVAALTLTWTGSLGGPASAATLAAGVAFPAVPTSAPSAPASVAGAVSQ